MLGSALTENGICFREKISGIDLPSFCQGFIPVFRDLSTDETHISTFCNGQFSDVHILDNLPIEWVEEWDENGYAVSLLPSIIAGYMRAGQFYTLFDLVQMRKDS